MGLINKLKRILRIGELVADVVAPRPVGRLIEAVEESIDEIPAPEREERPAPVKKQAPRRSAKKQ